MVDLLAKRPVTGFRIECSTEVEAQKRELEAERGVAAKSGVAVWPADDARWKLRPPYGFRHYVLKWGGYCVYCAEKIEAGTSALYSRKLNSVAHVSCHAGFDEEVPAATVKASVSDRLHDR